MALSAVCPVSLQCICSIHTLAELATESKAKAVLEVTDQPWSKLLLKSVSS